MPLSSSDVIQATLDPNAQKPRLPRLLRPANVNKRAQQIIAAHMRATSATVQPSGPAESTQSTMPVLMQLDSTAPRTAKTHDISHLCDKPSNLVPQIPPSLIEEADHEYETGFLPKDSSSVYHDEDGLWHTRVFPSAQPSSRSDAVRLDAWITRTLERYQEMCKQSANEDLATAVEDLVPILSVGLHEIVRQVTHHCPERGLVLEKIWRTYVELFDRVLHQMQESLQSQRKKTSEVQSELATRRDELTDLRRSHPHEMHRCIAELEVRFTKNQRAFEEELEQAEVQNSRLKRELKVHHSEVETWFPGFTVYQDSYVKNHIPQISRSKNRTRSSIGASVRGADKLLSLKSKNLDGDTNFEGSDSAQEEEIAPEVALAQDFKRLLSAIAPEKRKFIGKELATIMSGSVSKPKLRNSLQGEFQREEDEVLGQLQAEIKQQEQRIKELQEEVARLEAQKPRASLSTPRSAAHSIKEGLDQALTPNSTVSTSAGGSRGDAGSLVTA